MRKQKGSIHSEKIQFTEIVINEVKDMLMEEYEVSVQEVLKNNGVKLTGVIIRKSNDAVMPSIYIDKYFKEYQEDPDEYDFKSAAQDVLRQYHHCREHELVLDDSSMKFNFEVIKHQIMIKLINYDMNNEILQASPYVRYLDLAITFYCLINNTSDGLQSYRITNEHLKSWGITLQELHDEAMRNTLSQFPPKLSRMSEVIGDIMKNELLQDGIQLDSASDIDSMIEQLLDSRERESSVDMYVLTNQCGINGAASLLFRNELKRFADKLNIDLYILPSSIHELIIVPVSSEMDLLDMKNMVREINQTQVAEEEVLSNEVYIFERTENELRIAS